MNVELLAPPKTNRFLMESSNPHLRRLVVNLTEAELYIRGRVSSYYLKQLAQEQARVLADGRRIVNLVVVES